MLAVHSWKIAELRINIILVYFIRACAYQERGSCQTPLQFLITEC